MKRHKDPDLFVTAAPAIRFPKKLTSNEPNNMLRNRAFRYTGTYGSEKTRVLIFCTKSLIFTCSELKSNLNYGVSYFLVILNFFAFGLQATLLLI